MKELTTKAFLVQLNRFKSIAELKNVQRFFRDDNPANKFIGIRMSKLFELAKQFSEMDLNEVEGLLESEYYEARMGAVSIMDFQARNRKASPILKKQLFDLYIN